MSDAPERPLDLRELFRVLAEHGVDYLVIGGVAAQVHGRRRTTMDLDVTPAPDPDNFKRLAAALVALDAHPVELGPSAPAPTAEQVHLTPVVPPLTTRHGELHVLNEVPGATAYTGMRARALMTDLDGIPVHIVGVDDLIRMKRAAGRPSDIEDIEVLTMVAQREARSADRSKHRKSKGRPNPTTASDRGAETLVRSVLAIAKRQLGSRLESAYAIGSLGHGGFVPDVSDIDIALILDRADASDRYAIARINQQARRDSPGDLADRLSIFWSDWQRLTSGDYAVGRFPATDRLDLARSGRRLHGVDHRSRIALPDQSTLLLEVAGFSLEKLVDGRLLAFVKDPGGLVAQDARLVTKTVLFPVRFLYTAVTGRVDGNDPAAAWYCGEARWPGHELVREATQWRMKGLPKPAECERLLALHLARIYDAFLADYERRLASQGCEALAISMRRLREELQ